MNLKNYTSTVPAHKSIQKIEKLLVEMGAQNINKGYEGQVLKSITFLITIDKFQNTLVFRLPAKVDIVEKVMKEEIKRPREGTYEKVKIQAEKTAWKIVCDWVEIQATMIKLQQAEFIELFLPYQYSPTLDQTLFERIQSGDFKLLK